MMITENELKFQWEHSDEKICVCGYYLCEDEVMYILEVLHFVQIPKYDCYISDNTIIQYCTRGYREGTPPDKMAEQLMSMNKRIGEVA